MRRTARPTGASGTVSWSGPLLLGLQRLRIELRPTTSGCRGPLRGAGPGRARAAEIEERLEILGFVSTSELSWIHLHRPYYLSSPDGNDRLYAVLQEALARPDRLAVGQLVLHRRRQLVAIYGYRGALVAHLLRASSDVVDPRHLGIATVDADEQQWSPGPWTTTIPAAKRSGRRAPAPRVPGARVLDFTAALARRGRPGARPPETRARRSVTPSPA